jgi:hypothetical protein
MDARPTGRATAALLCAALAGCGAGLPRVWIRARPVLPGDVDRVVYADVGDLARSPFGRAVYARAGKRLGDECKFESGELLWVHDKHGHSALFMRPLGRLPVPVREGRRAGGRARHRGGELHRVVAGEAAGILLRPARAAC